MSAQIINLAHHRDAMRANAIKEDRETANAQRIETEKDELGRSLGGTIGAQLVASVAIDLQEAARERDTASQFCPAYCDPDNESRGAKFEATRGLDIREIAKRMRADIKAAKLPKGVKTSVRIERFAGGQSIDIRVTVLPEGFKVLSRKAASWKKQFPDQEHRMPLDHREAQSNELRALMDKLEDIHGAYNRDNSDSMSDYFDVRYYGDASLDWQVRRDHEAAQLAAEPGDYWADHAAD